MKKKLFALDIIVLSIFAAIFGIAFRNSYTNITAEDNYLDLLQIAEIPENLCIATCENMMQSLENAPIILRVSPADEIEHHFGLSQQRVIINQIFAGENLSVGDEIYITSYRWRVIINQSNRTIERGFVNILKDNSEYLVFLSDSSELMSDDIPVYYLFGESYISPVFCYDNMSNTIVSPTGESTYVPYSQVSGNEFFTTTEDGLQAWYKLKKNVLDSYPLQ